MSSLEIRIYQFYQTNRLNDILKIKFPRSPLFGVTTAFRNIFVKVILANIWRKELSPDRLFRGWWEELKKAYTRFCLQDKSDCARKCDVKHGTCNLWEDESVNEDDKDRWKYR